MIKINFYSEKLKLKHPWRISRETSMCKENVFIELKADNIAGYGECAPNVRYNETAQSTREALEKVRSYLEQSNLWHFEDIRKELHALIPCSKSAQCGINMAIMDWICKQWNLPLSKLYGIDGEKIPPTSFSIGIDEPHIMAKQVRKADNFKILKIKLGSAHDFDIVKAVSAATNQLLRIDVNEGWHSKEQALEKIKWLSNLNIEFIEQPLPATSVEDMVWLKQHSPILLIADESICTSRDILHNQSGFDGISVKLDKVGGLQSALNMIQLARELGLQVMIGCMVSSSLSITAACHLAGLADYVDLDGHLLITNDPFKGVDIYQSQIKLPAKSGIGATKKSV